MRLLKLSFMASTGLCLSLLSSPAYAQTSDEIVVTGLRQAYQGNFTPLEVPQAELTIDNKILSIAGALNLDEALDLSASVSRQNNFGGLWNSFSIRGFSGDINLPSGFLVNGFNAGRGFGGPRDLVGVESVEVLKGPRAALFGRGEPGGTINLITKRPTFETGGYVRGTVGSWNQYRVEGDVQTQTGIGDDDLGVRLVGFYEDSESFREGVEFEKLGFYPSATLNVGDNFKATYELEYTRQENPFDRGVVFSEEFGFSPRDVFVGESVPIVTEVIGHQFETELTINEDWSFLTGLGYRETSLEGDAFEPQFGSRQTFFQDGETIARFFRSRDFDADYVALRGELAGEFETGQFQHRLIFGADYDEFDNTLIIDRFRSRFSGDLDNLTQEDLAADLLLNVNNPIFGLNLNPNASPNTNRNEVLKGFGFYFQDQIEITDNLQIRVGGRFDDFEQDLTNFLGDATTITSEDSRFSPQVGIVYQVNSGLSLYGSYGEGFRLQTGQDFQGNQFDPNVTEFLEAGIKADLGEFYDTVEGSIGFTVFQVDQSNFLVNDDRPEATAVGFFSIPAGEAQSTGVEFDANVTFENNLSLWVSYAYTDAQFENSFADADGFGFTIDAGDPLINTPKHQFNIQAAKEFEVGAIPVQLGGGVLYVGDRNGFVGSDFELPDYTTVRAFAELEPIENISLRLDVDNIFNETFFTNSFADVWVQPGAPRRFRVSAAYTF